MAYQLNRSASSLHALVIGGVNADLWGSPAGALRLHDSNPGAVRVRPGGVGRNIAHNLRLLGLNVSMLTAFGGDAFGSFLREEVRAVGIDASLSLLCPDMRSSVYLYITDETGDMHVAISDMDIVSALTPQVLEQRLAQINAFDAVVLDANLSEESIAWLAAHVTAPLYADPVSTAKALRLKPALPALRLLKPNLLEASSFTGESVPARAARVLTDAGVGRVFISEGASGITAAEGDRILHVPAVPAVSVNANGAGDAATAALIAADLLGLPLEDSAALAAKAGALTVACEETNAPNLGDILL